MIPQPASAGAPPPSPRLGGPVTPPRRRGLQIMGVVGVLAVAAYLVGSLLAGDRLRRNAQISGVAVGGLDRAEAIVKLDDQLGKRAAQPITARVGDRTIRVDPADAGLGLDLAKSVDQAGARRSFDPRQIWRFQIGGTSTQAVVTADTAKLRSAVADIAERHDRPSRDARLTYGDIGSAQPTVTLKPARDATALRRGEAAEALQQTFLRDNPTVELPVDRRPAAVDDAAAQQVRQEFAEPAVSAPVNVKVGEAGQLSVTPSMVARSVTFTPESGTLVPGLDAGKLRDVARKPIAELDLDEPRDATVALDDGRPQVVPAVDGSIVSAAALADAVRPALTAAGAGRSVSVEPVRAEAQFTTEHAERLGVRR